MTDRTRILSWNATPAIEARSNRPADDKVIELAILVTKTEARKLEEMAHGHGLTMGGMVRSLIRDFVNEAC
jgi:hypothetical protein